MVSIIQVSFAYYLLMRIYVYILVFSLQPCVWDCGTVRQMQLILILNIRQYFSDKTFYIKTFSKWTATQSTVLPVPTRHRRHPCIKMRTALPANTKTRPNVVSMLVQRRWRWANIETALGQMLAFAGLHTGVCLHPPLRHHNILASRSGYF